jgi:hypothetical protein
MALWELEAFRPAQLLGFIRSLPDPEDFHAESWLPDRTIDQLKFSYILGANRKRVMASIMAFDSEAPIHGRPGLGDQVEGELPPIKRKAMIDESEILRVITPRTGTNDVQTAIDSVYNLLADLKETVQSRVEWLRVQGLTEDTLVYDEGGAQFIFDFGYNDLFQISLGATAGTAVNGGGVTEAQFGPYWDNYALSTPIDDLQILCQRIRIATGGTLARTVMSETQLQNIYRSQKTREMIRGVGAGAATTLVTPSELNAVLAQYNIPPIETYDVVIQKENADGTYSDVRPMRVNAVTVMPAPADLGNTLWGPTAESRVVYGTPLQGEAPGIWAGTYATEEPPAEWTKVAATSFPSIPGANRVGQMKVTA